MTPAQKESITGLILAGGRSSRMGGSDKALIKFKEKRLIDHVFERLAPQVGGVVINVNQNHEQYKSFGVRVVSDAIGTYAGPLAGLHAGLSVSRRAYLMSVPCDSPFFPENLVERMFDALQNSAAQIAVVMTGDQPHPVFALARRSVLEHLTEFLKGGGRKIDEWYDSLKVVHVEFEDEAQFGNINTPEELEAYEKGLPPPPKQQKQRFKREAKKEAEIPVEHHAILDSLLNGNAPGDAAAPTADVPAAAATVVGERRTRAIKGAPRRRAADKAVDALIGQGISLESVVSCVDGYDPNALPVAKVNEVVRAFVQPIQGFEQVAIRSALGRVLAEDIISPINVPAHDNSAMDGWALRSSDLAKDKEITLTEIGSALAGSEFTGRPGPGECVRITTGAPMPPGADTVVIKENVAIDGVRITVKAGEKAGANVRAAGEDYAEGDLAFVAGTPASAAELAVLAALGIAKVAVRRLPRIAVIATGDELVPPGQPLGFGQIHESNAVMLAALAHESGARVVMQHCVRDEPQALRTALLEAAADADLIVTSGGVSAGEADHLPDVLQTIGEIHFHKVRLKPGMPTLFGQIGACLHFGLPGNPVASAVTFRVFVRFALRAMLGIATISEPRRARLAAPLHKRHARAEFARCSLRSDEQGVLWATLHAKQGSGMLRGLAETEALALLPEEAREYAKGDVVMLWPEDF